MKKISLLENALYRADTGSQIKWRIGDEWYKIDDFNHEGLAETIVSDMMKKSNVERFAVYAPERIKYRGRTYAGCVSPNFLNQGERLIEATLALEGEYEAMMPRSITEFAELVKEKTALFDFPVYLAKMYALDQITLNTDRHYANIAILDTDAGYDYAPIFDNGRSFGLDDKLWMDGKSAEQIADSLRPRLYFAGFDKQTEEIEELAGGRKLILSYTKEDLRKTLDRCAVVYPDEILYRAEQIFGIQMQKHIEYFECTEKEEKLDEIKRELMQKSFGDCQFSIKNSVIEMRSPYDPEIAFYIDVKRNITPCKNGNQVSDDILLFKHNAMWQVYHELYLRLNEKAENREIRIERGQER